MSHSRDNERGIALIVCTLAALLLMALGAALVLSTSAETLIAANFRTAYEGSYAAGAAIERAIADLRNVADWSAVLDGSVQSGFLDGPPGLRTLPDGSTLDLAQMVNLANCGQLLACSDGQMDAITADRPWGGNNPRWRLYAYGSLSALTHQSIGLPHYLVVLAADDQAENDGNPLRDGVDPGNPGSGILVLRGDAFGPKGMHRGVEATVARGVHALRVLSWRERTRLDRP